MAMKNDLHQNSDDSPGDLVATVSLLKSEISQLSETNQRLNNELKNTSDTLIDMNKQLDSLKQEEIGLKRDLKIVQYKCDKLSS